MKHKHYDMIVAKAANMDLVKLIKLNSEDEWRASADQLSTSFYPNCKHFLCLKEHKESCLHWLNGGKIQNNITKHLRDDSWINFTPFESPSCELWSCECNFMREESNFRIKPKKEKRWIVAGNNSLHTMMYFSSADSAAQYNTNGRNSQIIEIEVEVQS